MTKTTTNSAVNVLEAIRSRRAVRAYVDEPVPETIIHNLLDAAVQAPTAMHLEPWAFVVIQDRALLKCYSDRAKSDLTEKSKRADGAGPAVPLHLEMLQNPAFNIFYDAGTLIVICRRIDSPFAEADCWLAAQNLMLAATAQGLGTCCIGFAVELLNASDIKRSLAIPAEGAAVAPIIVGRPRAMPTPVPRKSPEILRWVGR